MGSNYYGEMGKMGGESSTSSRASSTRRSKKSSSGNVDKPRQPQRGLGVAQLEKIRLHSQMSACSGYLPHANSLPLYSTSTPYHGDLPEAYATLQSPTYGYHPSFTMGYGDSQSSSNPSTRWINPSNGEAQYTQPSMTTRHLLEHVDQRNSSDLYESADGNTQELDLELRL